MPAAPLSLVADVAAAPAGWQQLLGLGVLGLTVAAVVRRVDVRLALLLGGLLLGALAGRPQAIVRALLTTFADEKFLVPIGTALGFAYVLRHTGCDQHLVHLLVRPLTRVRPLLVPGTVVVGYLVNLPVVSQASTAATLGPVVLPILRAAAVPGPVAGAALLLGSSVGGELLNPGAPELLTVTNESQKVARARPGVDPARYDIPHAVGRVLPLSVLSLAVAAAAFWVGTRREVRDAPPAPPAPAAAAFRVRLLPAIVPLVPVVFLTLASPAGLDWLPVGRDWLVEPGAAGALPESRLVGLAMLLGTAAAVLAAPGRAPTAAAAFCDGAGYGFAHVIAIIVAATCFGRGLTELGLLQRAASALGGHPALLFAAAGLLPLAFGALCGSGMASTQSLFGLFAAPALGLDVDPTHVGAVVAICAAAGRTMSPVAAVTVLCAGLSETHPHQLARRVAGPLLLAAAAVVLAALRFAPPP